MEDEYRAGSDAVSFFDFIKKDSSKAPVSPPNKKRSHLLVDRYFCDASTLQF
jgi:hypothetical protein